MRADPHRLEPRRLRADATDSDRDAEWDDLVALVAEICDVPMAAVFLVEDGRAWVRAEFGLDGREIPIVLQPGLTEIAAPSFYAGVGLEDGSGRVAGALCVLDDRPRTLGDRQRKALRVVARQLTAQLSLRRRVGDLESDRAHESGVDSLDAAEVATWVVDIQNGLTFTSPRLRFLFGLPEDTPAWAAVERYVAAVHSEDRKRVQDDLAHSIANGAAFDVEFRVTGNDGRERWVLSRGTVSRDEAGAPERLSGAIIDITDRRRAESERARLTAQLLAAAEANADANAKFQTFFDQGSYFAGVMTVDGTITEANRLCLEASGFAREEIVGRKFWDCGWWNRSPALMEMIREGTRQAASGSLFRRETPYFVADGAERVVDLLIAPVKDDAGRVLFLAPTGTDITERKRAEARDRFLIALDDAVRPLTEPDEVTSTAARLLGEHLRVDRCAYADIEADEDTMNLAGNYLRSPEIRSIVGRLTFTDFGLEVLALMRGDEPYVVNDVDTHQPPVGDLAAYWATQIQSVICVPLHKGGRFVAAMAVHCATPREWRTEEVELVRLVAARCWESIERVRIDRNLRESEAHFRTIFESAPDDAILMIDPEGIVLAWNPAAEAVCGWAAEEAVGQPAHLIFTPEDRAAGVPERELAGAAKNGKAADERWHLRRDGSRFWGSGTMNALYNADGTLRGFLKVFRDATARYEMERDIRALNDELEKRVAERTAALVAKNQELEGFSYSVAHDMRSPLRAIVSNARIALDEEGPNLSLGGQRNLERLAKAAMHMAHLVDDLLQYARLGTRELHRERVDVGDLAKRVLEEVAAEHPECRFQARIDCDSTATCDPRLVGMALHNLVDNACKYRDSQAETRIEFTCEEREGERVFAVRDNGIGFDMKYVSKLFVPFERLHREEYEGTGIGLANVKRAIERHGGRVWAEGAPGAGATFFFTLP